jgi:acetyl esterase/lipase
MAAMPSGRLIAELLLTRGRTYRYGPHRSQRADLHLPPAATRPPVIALVHGGSWQRGYGRIVMRGLACDLLRRGWAVWNIEYRRLGEGGGWPATFADVAAAIDHLGELPVALDRSRMGIVGHSAGGHLALWAAGRSRLPDAALAEVGGAPRVLPCAAVAMAGVCDLAGAYRRWRGGAVRSLMGGSPEHHPERYAVGDPLAHVPLALPVLLVHGVLDETVSVRFSREYARLSDAAGGEVELIELDGVAGRHRAHIDPRGAAWKTAASWLERVGRPDEERASAQPDAQPSATDAQPAAVDAQSAAVDAQSAAVDPQSSAA